MLEVTAGQAALGHLGGASILVNDNFSRTNGGKNIQMGVHGSYDDVYIMPTSSTWGDGDERTTMYMRKGYLHLERNSDATDNKSQPSGMIQADRLVTNIWDGTGMDATERQYDYQVNPAYTSMMHDIKLATRGGARLSDILPDFINKGIYVMDNTYYGSANWAPTTSSGDYLSPSMNGLTLAGLTDCGNSVKCDTSAWMGFIPTPNCPPGYMKVATITPIRFAMAQAGIPIEVSGNGGITGNPNPKSSSEYRLLGTRKDPRGDKIKVGSGSGNFKTTGDTILEIYENGAGNNIEVNGEKLSTAPEYWATIYNAPYTFQVSTWLNTTLKAHYTDNAKTNFKGWHGIMGFIYPAQDYADYICEAGLKSGYSLSADSITKCKKDIKDTDIVWNLFPVYKEELSAIATVYCYFNRTAIADADKIEFEDKYVDKYLPHQAGSMGAIRNKTKPDDAYTKRLNDPTLNYDAVW